MSESDAIDRTLQGPGTVDSLSRDLNSLGVTEGMVVHDHPLRSGAREQGIGRWGAVQHAAIEQAPEDVLALLAAIEPVAVLVEVGLQVGGAHAVEDVERPALEVGEHDMREGQPRVDVGACRGVAGQMSVAGALKAGVAVPAVGLHQAAGDDRGKSRLAQARDAGVGDDAQVGAPEDAARGVPRGHGDQRLAGLAAAAALRPLVLAADEALVELDESAQQMLALAALHGLDDLATQKPGGLAGHAELTGQLSRRGRLLGGCQQPDCEEPLAQVGARAGEDGAGGQRTLVVAAGALIEAAATKVPGLLVPAASTGKALRPAMREERLPAVLLAGVHLHELDQRLRMPHHLRLLLGSYPRGYSGHRTEGDGHVVALTSSGRWTRPMS